jgi:hypothetical protein
MGDTGETKLLTTSRIIYKAWPRDANLAKAVRESAGQLYDDKLRCDIAEGLNEKARSLDDVPYAGAIKEAAETLQEIQRQQYREVVKEAVDLINNRMEVVMKAAGPAIQQLTEAIEKIYVEREAARMEEKKRKLEAKMKRLAEGAAAKKKKPRKEESSEEADDEDGDEGEEEEDEEDSSSGTGSDEDSEESSETS